MCVFSSHSFWTSSSLDVPAGVTQEEGHTGFLIHLPSAVRALIFVAMCSSQCIVVLLSYANLTAVQYCIVLYYCTVLYSYCSTVLYCILAVVLYVQEKLHCGTRVPGRPCATAAASVKGIGDTPRISGSNEKRDEPGPAAAPRSPRLTYLAGRCLCRPLARACVLSAMVSSVWECCLRSVLKEKSVCLFEGK